MNQITQREQEVLHLIANEHSSKEIASRLYVSYDTIISHRKNIMRKLEVKNVAGMVRAGFEIGLLRAGVIALLLFCLPEFTLAQSGQMVVESGMAATSPTTPDPVHSLISGNTDRPLLQFSENAGSSSLNDGMSIEYNGRSNGAFNFISINSVGGSSAMAIFNEGNVNVRGFSRFGSAPPPGVTAPAIKIVELIHTQEGPQVGELVDLPAGISGSKILDIKTVAQVGSLFTQPNTDFTYAFQIVWNESQITINPTDTIGGDVTYTFTIMYKE